MESDSLFDEIVKDFDFIKDSKDSCVYKKLSGIIIIFLKLCVLTTRIPPIKQRKFYNILTIRCKIHIDTDIRLKEYAAEITYLT